MSLSLRDQLLKAGLVNEKQAKQAAKQKQKQQRLEHKGQAEKDDSQREAALKAQAEKLTRQQQEKAQKKALAAQVRQLTEGTRLPRLDGDDYYNFVDDKKVKRIAVNPMLRDKLSRGTLAIVRLEGKYELIPREAALKVQEREPQRIVLLNVASEVPDAEDDPYKDYVIPDDLMW